MGRGTTQACLLALLSMFNDGWAYLERIVGEVMRCHARLVEHGVISLC